jgi:hypothetical protein
MTISFPRAMPSVGGKTQSFEPVRVDYLSPEAGSRLGAVTAGWPVWGMSLSLNNMPEDDADIWRAWLLIQRGPQNLFYGRDLDRSIPKAHRDGTPFAATADSWSASIDGTTGVCALALVGVDDTTLSIGDYIAFEWDTWKRSLVRVVEGGTADGSGNLTVAVEPPVHPITPSDAVATLLNPTCLMRLDSKNTSIGEQDDGFTVAGSRIVGVQDLVA